MLKITCQTQATAALIFDVAASSVVRDGDKLFIVDCPENFLTNSDIVLYSLQKLEKDIFADYEYQAVSNPGVGAAHFAEVKWIHIQALLKFWIIWLSMISVRHLILLYVSDRSVEQYNREWGLL